MRIASTVSGKRLPSNPMNVIDSIAIGVAFISFAGILRIVLGKFPLLARLDVERIRERKEAVRKRALLEERLRRKLLVMLVRARLAFQPLGGRLMDLAKALAGRIRKWEEEYTRRRVRGRRPEDRAAMEQKIRTLLLAADEFAKKEEYLEAERRIIEAIALNPKRVETYRVLGGLSLAKKDYDQAKETFKHLLKLNHDDAAAYSALGLVESQLGHLDEAEKDYLKSVALAHKVASYHLDLGLVYRAKGENAKALLQFREATSLEPENPKYLDYQLEEALTLEDKNLAEETWSRLAKVNPENQKLPEFKTRIEELEKKPVAPT